jgi:hypothetical protein
VLANADGERRVPSEQRRYYDLYAKLAAAVRGDGVQPVPASEGIRTLAFLDAARLSAEQAHGIDDSCRCPASQLAQVLL